MVLLRNYTSINSTDFVVTNMLPLTYTLSLQLETCEGQVISFLDLNGGLGTPPYCQKGNKIIQACDKPITNLSSWIAVG